MAGDIGVLALQGDVSEHIRAFESACAGIPACRESEVVPVRSRGDLEGLAALAIPGGESTTISRLIGQDELRDAIATFPGGVFATCAGMVLAAAEVDDDRVRPLGLFDMAVQRNAFGRQRESFEAEIAISGLDQPFPAVFIRAPVAVRTWGRAAVLGRLGDRIVAVRQGPHMAVAFHPELTTDTRLHHLFLSGL
ncbi:MAG: pyridoxal 5'-phosphate synthase glutaminase subunit PdxT [Methanomicrobiales archaeon]